MKQLPPYYLTRYQTKRSGFFYVKTFFNNQYVICLCFTFCVFFLFLCLATIKGAVHYKQVEESLKADALPERETAVILNEIGHVPNPTLTDFFYEGLK